MKKNIRKLLKKLEKDNKIKILFAIENGSRAWSIASKDSDYDVRFVYFRKTKDYLKLDKDDDVINIAYDKDLNPCEAQGSLIDMSGFDIYKYLKDFSDKYSLHAYQNYEVDAVKVSEDKYMILFSMAEIYDNLKVPELDKMLLGNYIAVVYNSKTEKFSYYLLEKSLDGYYAFCSIDENMEHTTHSFIENSKKSFVENVILISGK